MLARRTIACALVALLVVACGGDQGTTPTPAKPLTIVSGANVTDTVLARLPLALTVEVRVNGELRAGTVVRFEALPPADTLRRYETAVALARLTSNQYSSFLADSTDSSGRVRGLVTFGTVSGEARVAISVPALGLVDTARFTVIPGAGARVRFAVRDTAIRVAGSYTSVPTVTDRFGNRRTDTPSLEVGTL